MPAGDSIPALFMRTQSGGEFKTAAARIVSYSIIVWATKTKAARHKLDRRLLAVAVGLRSVPRRRVAVIFG
jgi:hypothetical protein